MGKGLFGETELCLGGKCDSTTKHIQQNSRWLKVVENAKQDCLSTETREFLHNWSKEAFTTLL